MANKNRSGGAKQTPLSAAEKLPPAKATVRRTSADRLKLASRLHSAPQPESVAKAAKAFENFNLSRFSKDAVPSNYIDRHKVNVKNPAAVQGVQRDIITGQLEDVSRVDARNSGLTLAFAKDKLEEIAKALPGLQANGGKIDLDDLLGYLRARMNGTNIYSNGNPVVRRLTTEMQLRAQAQSIIDRIASNGAAGKGRPKS